MPCRCHQGLWPVHAHARACVCVCSATCIQDSWKCPSKTFTDFSDRQCLTGPWAACSPENLRSWLLNYQMFLMIRPLMHKAHFIHWVFLREPIVRPFHGVR